MRKLKFFLLLFVFFTSPLLARNSAYVLLISFDGFRWDYAHRNITPNIERMIREGVSASSFQPCFPSKTFPNHQSIITGMYIEHHGIIANRFENPFTKETYRLGDKISTSESKWYLGEPFWQTAKRNGIKTASFFWPGSELDLDYRRPDYVKHYNQNFPYYARVDTVMKWLQMPYDVRPHFITLYFSLTDTYGHKYGPNSKEINYAISQVDSVLGYLFNRVNKIGLEDSLNIILVSDHGMTEVDTSRTINIEKILKGKKYKMQGSGPFVLISPSNNADEIYSLLKKNENHYKVYTKENIPDYYHYSSNPFIPEIIVIADLGWEIGTDKSIKEFKEHPIHGDHGFDNHQLDMHGIFFAMGPAFKRGYKTGTILNIDVYPLLCKIFNIAPANGIDGKAERIKFILKN